MSNADVVKVRLQLQRSEGHVLDLGGVEAQDAEVVDGVAVHGVDVAFLVVIEDAVSNEGTGTDDVLGVLA